jgi:hypothetical protein
MSWLILGLVMFVPTIPSFFRLMKLAHDQSVLQAARRAELKRQCDLLGGPDSSLSGCAKRTGTLSKIISDGHRPPLH